MLLLLQRRFCSHLNMENNEVRAATETVKKSEMLDIRLVPSSSLSVIYFLVCEDVSILFPSPCSCEDAVHVVQSTCAIYTLGDIDIVISVWLYAGRVLYLLLQLLFT